MTTNSEVVTLISINIRLTTTLIKVYSHTHDCAIEAVFRVEDDKYTLLDNTIPLCDGSSLRLIIKAITKCARYSTGHNVESMRVDVQTKLIKLLVNSYGMSIADSESYMKEHKLR